MPNGIRCDGASTPPQVTGATYRGATRRVHEHQDEEPDRRGALRRVRRDLILILFGCGVVAQVVDRADGALGDHDSISWAWGLGVTLGVYVAARLTGAHLNPAVTIALAAYKGFEWRKVRRTAWPSSPGRSWPR